MVKSVQDFADDEKDDRFRQFACRSSADFLIHVLKNLFKSVPKPQYTDDIAADTEAQDLGASCRPPHLYAQPAYMGSHQFVGRRHQLEFISEWSSPADRHPILLYQAIGGSGKSILAWEWLTKYALHDNEPWKGRFWYSFYERGATMVDFCRKALAYTHGCSPYRFRKKSTAELLRPLLDELSKDRWLLVLDGLERVLVSYHRLDAQQMKDEDSGLSDGISVRHPCAAINPEDDDLLRALAKAEPSKILITSRLVPRPLINNSSQTIPGVLVERLPGLKQTDAESLIKSCGVTGDSARLQSYLRANCDCHPLVIGALAGLVNDYLPDRGNFDSWMADSEGGGALNLANLDLVQRRNHILTSALNAVPEQGRKLLSILALLSASVDYKTLDGLNPFMPALPDHVEIPKEPSAEPNFGNKPALEKVELMKLHETRVQARVQYENSIRQREAQRNVASEELTLTIKDLEQRGLLQYDHTLKRYDLHPVVRGVAVGGLNAEDKFLYGQQLVDHFSKQAQSPFSESNSLVDFENSFHIIRALVHMGDLAGAKRFLEQTRIVDVLGARFEAHNEIVMILKPFFLNGWKALSLPIARGGAGYFTRRAGVALRRLGAFDESFQVAELGINEVLKHPSLESIISQLLNLASTAGEQNRLNLENRLMDLAHLALEPSMLYHNFSYRISRFRQLSRLGMWQEAEKIWEDMGSDLDDVQESLARHHRCLNLYFRGLLAESEVVNCIQRSTSPLARRNLIGLSGALYLEQGNLQAAKERFKSATELARKVGKVDRRNEIRLALTRVKAGELDALEASESLSYNLPPQLNIDVAELLMVGGYAEKAKQFAQWAFPWAQADGHPYVVAFDLERLRKIFVALSLDFPTPKTHDRAKETPYEWEGQLKRQIALIKGEYLV